MALIQGTSGDEVLEGGAADDTLDGGAGGEALFGGPGADTFVLRASEGGVFAGGPERIMDFQLGLDRVQITSADGYQPWVADAVQDGVAGTMLTYGWNDDRMFIGNVSGATLEQLWSDGLRVESPSPLHATGPATRGAASKIPFSDKPDS